MALEKLFLDNIFNEIPFANPYESSNNDLSLSKKYTRFSEIKKNLQSYSDENEYLQFLYDNKKLIEIWLYKFNEIIKISFDKNNKGIKKYFFLHLLIFKEQLINYSFDKNLIIELNNINKNENPNFIKIIRSKMIINFIKDFNDDDEELKEILNDNKEFINNNIKIFKSFQLTFDTEEIIEKRIDLLYIEIINNLLRTNKFNDLNSTKIILEELDIININITESMFAELNTILNRDNDFIKRYEILDIKDLFDEEKINFFYLLLKYVLKNKKYIYINSFLLKTRTFIIKLIKNNFSERLCNIDFILNKKISFVVEFLLDNEYYSNIFLDSINIIQLLKYYKFYLFKSKKDDIKCIDNLIKNNNIKNYGKYLKDSEKNNINLSLKLMNNDENKKINKIKQINNIIVKKDKLISKPEFFVQKENINNNKICLYSSLETNIIEEIKIGEKILTKCRFEVEFCNNKCNIKKIYIGDNYISLNFENYIKSKYTCQEYKNKNEIAEKATLFNNIIFQIIFKIKNNFNMKYKLLLILSFENKDDKISCQYTIDNQITNVKEQFNDDNIFNTGADSANLNKLYSKINDKNFYENYRLNSEKHEFKKERKNKLKIDVFCNNRKIESNNNSKNFGIPLKIEMDRKKYLTISMNETLKGNEHELNFYDNHIKRKKIIGIKFSSSQNFSAIFPDFEGNCVLLFSCEKYCNKKNGILLIILLKFGKEIEIKYFETIDIELYSFCPITIKENSDQKETEYKSDEFKNETIYNRNCISIIINEKSKYFLVGGLYKKEKTPVIILYKLTKTSSNYTITPIKNIEIGNNEGYNGPIQNIIQLKNDLNKFAFKIGEKTQYFFLKAFFSKKDY